MKSRILAFVLVMALLGALLPGLTVPVKALTRDEAELYIPVVERILERAIDVAGDYMLPITTRGILYDVDEDGVTELVLSYPCMIEEPGYWEYAYGVYDIEQGKVVTLAEDVTFGATAAAAGSNGYSGVALYKGEPVLITCAEGGETSTGMGAKYPAWKCEVKVYAFDSLRCIRTLLAETTHEQLRFAVDGRSVSENEFLKEMDSYTYLEYELYRDVWITMTNTMDKQPLNELLKALEKKASEKVPETTQAPVPETTEAPVPETTKAPAQTNPPTAKPTEGKQDAPAATKPTQNVPTKPAQAPQEGPQQSVEKEINWIYIVIGVIGAILVIVIVIKAWKLILILVLIGALVPGALFQIRKYDGGDQTKDTVIETVANPGTVSRLFIRRTYSMGETLSAESMQIRDL